MAAAPDLEVEPLRERVDNRDPDAVQTTGDLVTGTLAELCAGVKGGQHDLRRRLFLLRVALDGNPATVVGNAARIVRVKGDLNPIAVTGQCLINRVVDDFKDEMVQPARAG